MRPILAVTLALLAPLALAQKDFQGRDEFPQFRNLGGLPGNMVPVGPDGIPNYFGALSLSTPTAYTLGGWHGIAGFGTMSFDSRLRSPEGRDGQTTTNSTAQFMLGSTIRGIGNFSATYMVLSNLGDGAFNFSFTPANQPEKVKWAIGIQDLRGGGGAAGENIPGDSDSSASLYTVTTFKINEKTHASIGTGTRRFKGFFGNISTNITPNIKTTLEYDAFNWNVGVAFRLTSLGNTSKETYDEAARKIEAHAFLGFIRGKSIFWGVGISF